MTAERARIGDVLALQRREVVIEPMTEYRLVGIYSFGKGIFHREPTLGAELGDYRFFAIKPGDLVLSNIQAWEGAIAYATEVDRATIGTHRFLSYVPTDGRVDTNWARWYFLSEPGMAKIRRAAPGTTMRNRTLAIDRFEALEIPVPPIPEQRQLSNSLTRLAASLRPLSELHSSRQQKARALVDAEVARTFAAMPGKDRALGTDIEIVAGATPDSRNPMYWDGEIRWVTPTDLGALTGRDLLDSARRITPAGFDSCSTQWVEPGGVVMSSRAPIGHLAIARVALCTNQGCKTFIPPPGVQPEYLYWAIRSALPRIRSAGTGTTFQEVSATKLRGIAIPVPERRVQQTVVSHLDEVDRLARSVLSCVAVQRRRIAALLPAALNEAFAGLN
jgi:type I restriction enzyme S subunit